MSATNHCESIKVTVDEPSILENNLLFKIELADGTFQWVQIPENQAHNLGLQFNTEDKLLEKVPVISPNVNTQHESINNIEIPEKQNEDTSHFVYKIVKPEDLNLKPNIKTHLPRGRPRKRPSQKTNSDNTKPDEELQKVVKQVRTRSGRITKPPKHIEKDFKKIVISDDCKNETDLKTSEFEPLTTNETPTEEPLQVLEQHSKKRNIPSRFRCPTCNKAYLGRIRMMSHFHKHPDHGPLPKYCKLKHNTTWNFLILTSQKYKEGPKGAKFCQELDVLLQNARTLAQYLFKPCKNDKEGYFINETLANIFGISAGNYNIDETELTRDVTLYEYLEGSDNSANIDNIGKINGEVLQKDIEPGLKVCEKNTGEFRNENVSNTFNSFGYINNDESNNVSNFAVQNSKKDYTADNATNIEKSELNLNNINLTLAQSNHTDIDFSISDVPHNVIKEQLKGNCARTFLHPQNSNNTSINSSNCLAVVKYEMQPKHSFVFSNHEYDTITSEIDINVMDTSQLSSLTNYNNLEIKGESVFMKNSKEGIDTSQNISEKQSSHITLQNELHDVDELILVNVDTNQVSSILDNSSNSDDIMNVDQFVNERFKKLTEQDMDIQNNLLNLDLPPLDLFQFHTS